MSELGTKDVLEQVDARLSNVEQDIRGLRTEMNARFADVTHRFDRLENKLDTTTRWLVGLVLLGWLSLMVSIWLKS